MQIRVSWSCESQAQQTGIISLHRDFISHLGGTHGHIFPALRHFGGLSLDIEVCLVEAEPQTLFCIQDTNEEKGRGKDLH